MITDFPVDYTGPAVLAFIALLVITDRLVWHTRLRQQEERAARWERIALDALGVAKTLTVQSEVTNDVLSRLPDPGADR